MVNVSSVNSELLFQSDTLMLLEEFQDVSSWHDLDLGEMSLVEHVIHLKPNTGAPFKEQY